MTDLDTRLMKSAMDQISRLRAELEKVTAERDEARAKAATAVKLVNKLYRQSLGEAA